MKLPPYDNYLVFMVDEDMLTGKKSKGYRIIIDVRLVDDPIEDRGDLKVAGSSQSFLIDWDDGTHVIHSHITIMKSEFSRAVVYHEVAHSTLYILQLMGYTLKQLTHSKIEFYPYLQQYMAEYIITGKPQPWDEHEQVTQ